MSSTTTFSGLPVNAPTRNSIFPFDLSSDSTTSQATLNAILGVLFGTSTLGTWGTGSNTQTAQVTINGATYADNPHGEHLFINSYSDSPALPSANNVVGFWGKGQYAVGGARFITGVPGKEVGAVGYLPDDPEHSYYADNMVFLAGSLPYSIADGSFDSSQPPPNVGLAQEGNYAGTVRYTARLHYHTDWSLDLNDPLGTSVLHVPAVGGVCTLMKTILSGSNDASELHMGTGGTVYGSVSAFDPDFVYHAYPPSGVALLGFGAGGVAIMSTSTGPIRWYTGGDDNGHLRGSLDSLGNWVLGSAALSTSATDGFVSLSSCAGVPTGVPTLVSGTVPMVVDSSDGRLYLYYGGAWHYAVLV